MAFSDIAETCSNNRGIQYFVSDHLAGFVVLDGVHQNHFASVEIYLDRVSFLLLDNLSLFGNFVA